MLDYSKPVEVKSKGRRGNSEVRKLILGLKKYVAMSIGKSIEVKKYVSGVTVIAVSVAMAFPAYADGLTVTDAAIKTMLNSTIDVVFLIFSVGIAVMGAFQLIPAIIHFIQASNSQNGEQRKEAGSGIGTSIMILLLAGLVFMLKTPLKGLVGLGS